MASSSQSQLRSISVVLPPGLFDVVLEKVADGINGGMCAVVEAGAASPVQVGDIIVSLNGIELKEVKGGVKEWCQLIEAFSKGERELAVRRTTRQPGASSRGLQGFREMASAKKRLATAERWNNSNMEAAKKAEGRLKAAQKEAEKAKAELRASQKEVNDAKSSLENVKRDYEVIDVDAEDNRLESGIDVKRKVSLSPDGGSGKKARTDVLQGNVTDAKQVVVEGAGSSDVNGTYKRWHSNRGDSFPTFEYDSTHPVYAKDGLWKGAAAKFFIYRSGYSSSWWIGWETDDRVGYFYLSKQFDDLPPKNGWIADDDGIHPAPQLKW